MAASGLLLRSRFEPDEAKACWLGMSQGTSDEIRDPASHVDELLADESLFRLRACTALFTALEEAVIAALSDMAKLTREAGADEEAEQMEWAIRLHRIGLVKHRAVMHACDLETRRS